MKKNRIALFLPAIDAGGVARVMIHLSGGLIKEGFEVDLVVAKAPIESQKDLPEGVRLVELPETGVLKPITKLIGWMTEADYFADSLQRLPGFIRYLRRTKPKALLSGSANIVAILASKLSNMKGRVLVTVAVHQSVHFKNVFSGVKRIYPIIHNLFLYLADGIVVESEGIADDLVKSLHIPKEDIWVIYNPVVTKTLYAKMEEAVELPWLDGNEYPIIIGVGRLTKQKNFPTLLEAFNRVRQQRKAKLIILGDGPDRQALCDYIDHLGLSEDVAMLGYRSNPFAYMKQASVFVLSSKWEGFGNVVAEALAVGTPVVSTDCLSGPREILDNGEFGRLVPVGDARAMAAAIIETIDHPPERADLQARGRVFSLETALPQFLAAMHL